MLLLSEVRDQLGDKNLKEVARRTGLSYDTVWRVYRGDTKRVSYDVVMRLSEYLEQSKVREEHELARAIYEFVSAAGERGVTEDELLRHFGGKAKDDE